MNKSDAKRLGNAHMALAEAGLDDGPYILITAKRLAAQGSTDWFIEALDAARDELLKDESKSKKRAEPPTPSSPPNKLLN